MTLIFSSKVIVLFCIFSILSNVLFQWSNKIYEQFQNEIPESPTIIARIVDNGKEKEYKKVYQVKIETIGKSEKDKGKKLLIQVPKKEKQKLEYGDKIELKGKWKKPVEQRNTGGFNYCFYLKTVQIYGTIKVDKVTVLEKNTNNFFLTKSNDLFLAIKHKVEALFEPRMSSLLLGILLGYTEEIEDDVKEAFQKSSLSHVLAVSGMHVSYLILGITVFLNRSVGKRKAKYITILFLILYLFLTHFSPSVVRACTMGIILLVAGLIYRKPDTWTSLFLSLFLLLLQNPFSLFHVGLQLSYLGTMGILFFQKDFSFLWEKIQEKTQRYLRKKILIKNSWQEKLKEGVAVILAAQMMIFPIMITTFHTISLSFLLTNLLVSAIIGILLILGFVQVIVSFLFFQIAKLFSVFLNPLLELLIQISYLGSHLPFSQVYVSSPNLFSIVSFLLFLLFFHIGCRINASKKETAFQKRIKNVISLFCYQIKQKRKQLIFFLLFFLIILFILSHLPKKMEIHFIDVGQGDSIYLSTPKQKNILIDGGGSESKEFDIGENTLLPYLLNKKVKKLDYVMISHFDQDHVGGLFTVMEKLPIDNIIIGKQFENSENYQKFIRITKEKKIKVHVIEAGQKIKIEKNVFIDVLWPDSENVITENSLNNNSLVCKFVYKDFSILFTGDIEEVAEKAILDKYENNVNILKSTVLKVPHHRIKNIFNRRIFK